MEITANVLRISRSLLDAPDQRRYGYELMICTGLASPSMYKALHRMEAAGWLESYPEPGTHKTLGRAPRRYYEITGQGRMLLKRHIKRWASMLRGDLAA